MADPDEISPEARMESDELIHSAETLPSVAEIVALREQVLVCRDLVMSDAEVRAHAETARSLRAGADELLADLAHLLADEEAG